MLIKTRASTARCNEAMYTSYLLSEPNYSSCVGLSNVMQTISHDSINRFLERERFEPKDLFDEEKGKIEWVDGILSDSAAGGSGPESRPSNQYLNMFIKY